MSSKLTDQQTNILLVREIEKRPILYNYLHPGYMLKHKTRKAWTKVGKIVNLQWYDCKERWKNIRAAFIKHMKHHNSRPNAERRDYYLADALQFCIPYIKALSRHSGNLLQLQPKKEILYVKNNEDDDDDLISDTPLQSPSSVSIPNFSPSILTPISTLLQNEDYQFEPKIEYITENDDVYNKYPDSINETSSTECEKEDTESRKESLKMYLLSMHPDLMKMSDQQLQQFKRQILDVMDDILFNQHG